MTDDSLNSGPHFPFQLVDESSSRTEIANSNDIVVRVPIGVSTQRALLRCFDASFHFPNWFGWNWDALRECLIDFSWRDSSPPRVIIEHDDLPFVDGQRERSIYLELLRDGIASRTDNSFIVRFPQRHERAIRRCLAAAVGTSS